ncbi:MAG: ribonuclease H-like domain-containing protein [Candidatus Aenigmarchaeota archaeon]|nr:ribonuclease H-like domain-containing protein [Candidatus Aenigmarchaeota archaeon]
MKQYLDIETTGLSKYRNSVTVIGIYNGEEVIQLVEGIDLTEDSLSDMIRKTKKIVTFNGKRFDIPFLSHKYPNIDFSNLEHHDLMYSCWKHGWKGGQKAIEQMLDLSRDSGITNGLEAVRLWKRYRNGCENSLKKLLEYNKEDIVNLYHIEKALEEKGKENN